MRGRLTVGRWILAPAIGVQIPAPQPFDSLRSLMAIAIINNIECSERGVLRRVEESMSFIVYILRTSSNTLYIGQTNNLEKRLNEHRNRSSKSAKYIKYFDSFELVYSETFSTRLESMRREFQIKKWTRAKKEALISGNLQLLKKL